MLSQKKINKNFVYIFLVIVPCIVFFSVFNFQFVSYDDDKNIYDNEVLFQPFQESIQQFWTEPFLHLYIPVPYTTWALLAKVSRDPSAPHGLDASLFHLANLLVHIGNVLLLFLLLKALFGGNAAAGVGALLFAVHPVQVESVAWVTELKGLLAVFFSFSAVLLYVRYAQLQKAEGAEKRNKKSKKQPNSKPGSGGLGLYLGACVLFFAALLSKPSSVTVPFIALALDYWLIGRSFKSSLKSLIPWFVLLIPFILLTMTSQQADERVFYITPLWARPLIALDSLAFYLYKLIFPFISGIDYGRTPQNVLNSWYGYVTWTVPVALGLVIYFIRKRFPEITASALIFLFALAPVLGIIPFYFQDISTVADRYMYPAMLGVAVFITYVVQRYENFLIKVFLFLLIILFSVFSFFHVQVWKNDLTLNEHSLEVNPKSVLSAINLGEYYERNNEYKNAEVQYKNALKNEEDNVTALNNLANVYARQKNYKRSIQLFKKVLEIQPDHENALFSLGAVLTWNKQYAESIPYFLRGLKINPDHIYALRDVGMNFARIGKPTEAEKFLQRALQLNPGFRSAEKALQEVRKKFGK